MKILKYIRKLWTHDKQKGQATLAPCPCSPTLDKNGLVWPSHWRVKQLKLYEPPYAIPTSEVPHEPHRTLVRKAARYGISLQQMLALYYDVFEVEV